MMEALAVTEEHIGYAERLARKFSRAPYASHIEAEDIKSSAYLGLCQAAKHYDSGRGVPFTAFSYPRINGAMFDELSTSPNALQTKHVPYFEYFETDEDCLVESACVTNETPEDKYEAKELVVELHKHIVALPPKERAVIHLHYFQSLQLSSIATRLGEGSRTTISRTHQRALNRLRTNLQLDAGGALRQ